MHGTTGSGAQFIRLEFAGELFGKDQPLDATKFFIVLPDGIGHGKSSKPSDGMLQPRAKDSLTGPTWEENLAFIQTIFSEKIRAISILTHLLQTPYFSWLYSPTPITPDLLRLDPIWDPLRGDPTFQKLCEEKQPPAAP